MSSRKEVRDADRRGLRGKLPAGTRLVARYRAGLYEAPVVVAAEGKPRYRLADGRESGSLSAAGRAVMGGVACNGWRFWSLAPESEAAASPEHAKPAARPEPNAGA